MSNRRVRSEGSRNVLVRGKLYEVSTASTAEALRKTKEPQKIRVSVRSISAIAVGSNLIAGCDGMVYRSQEIPANVYLSAVAVDAVDTYSFLLTSMT
jgi:hypothetical protein